MIIIKAKLEIKIVGLVHLLFLRVAASGYFFGERKKLGL